MRTADEVAQRKRPYRTPLYTERIRRGLTIRDVIAELGVSSTSVYSKWEMGDTFPASRELMQQIADFYGVDADVLWGSAWEIRGLQEAQRAARSERTPRERPRRVQPVSRPPKRLPVRDPLDLPDEVTPRGESRLRALLREKVTA